MTNRAAEPASRHHANDAPPPFQQGPDASRPVRKASLIAGVALLFLLALWLVIRGRRITVSQPVLRAEPAGAAR